MISIAQERFPLLSIGQALISFSGQGDDTNYLGGKFSPSNLRANTNAVNFMEQGKIFGIKNSLISSVFAFGESYADFTLAYAHGDCFGILNRNKYAIACGGKIVLSGSLQKRVSRIIYVSADLVVLSRGTTIFALQSDGQEVWSLDLQLGSGIGIIHDATFAIEPCRLCINYGEQGRGNFIYILDLVNGEVISLQDLEVGVRSGSILVENGAFHFSDGNTMYQIDGKTGVELLKVTIPFSEPIWSKAYTKNTICFLLKDSSSIAVVDKKTAALLHFINLGGGEFKGSDIIGNDFGIVIELVSSSAMRLDEATYAAFISEDDLMKGVAPVLAPEALQASATESGPHDNFDLLIQVRSGLGFADFLRHTSFALWKFSFDYAYYVDSVDRSISRPGDSKFSGRIVLDIGSYKLDEGQSIAFGSILSNARQIMCGEGPARGCLWAGTQNGVNVSIEVKQ